MAGALAIMAGLAGMGKLLSSAPSVPPLYTEVPLSQQPNSYNIYEQKTVDSARATLQREADRRMGDAAVLGSRTVNRFINSIAPTAESAAEAREQAHRRNVTQLQSNMVPFMRGNESHQPMQSVGSLRLEQFTANSSEQLRRPKQEALSFYEKGQINNVFPGNQPSTRSNTVARTSQIVSRLHQGVPLAEPIHVGPGVTKTYSADPSGGRHSMFRPTFKSVDELRTVNDHQRTTMRGKILSGQKGSVRGLTGDVPKNRPSKVYVPIQPVPTAGDTQRQTAPTYREPLKHTVRQVNEGRDKYQPPAASVVSTEGTRPTYINDDRGILSTEGAMEMTASAAAGGGGQMDPNQMRRYDADPYTNKPIHNIMGAPNMMLKGPVNDPDDQFEITRKQQMSEFGLSAGTSLWERGPVHDPSDRPELGQRVVDGEQFQAGAGMASNSRGPVQDPSDRPVWGQRVVDGEWQQGGAGMAANARGPVQDPSDRPMWGQRVMDGDWQQGGAGMATDTMRGPVHDPMDQPNVPARMGLTTALTATAGPLQSTVQQYDTAYHTTRRDELGDATLPVQVGRVLPAQGTVHDPSDKPVPQRNVTRDSSAIGTIASSVPKGTAQSRDPSVWVHNKATPLVSYVGNVKRDRGSGYLAAKWEQKNTQRQKLTDFLFLPAAAQGNYQGSGARHAAYHLDGERRKEALLKTHGPTPEGSKTYVGADTTNLKTTMKTTRQDQAYHHVQHGYAIGSHASMGEMDDTRHAQRMPFRLDEVIKNDMVTLPGAQFS